MSATPTSPPPAEESDRELSTRIDINSAIGITLDLSKQMSDIYSRHADLARECLGVTDKIRLATESSNKESLKSNRLIEARFSMLKNQLDDVLDARKNDIESGMASAEITKIYNNFLEDRLKLFDKIYKRQKVVEGITGTMSIGASVLNKHLSITGEHWKNIKEFIVGISSIKTAPITLISAGIDRFVKIEEAFGKFMDDTGLVKSQLRDIVNISKDINLEFAHLGVNINEAYKSSAAIVKEFGSGVYVTKELVKQLSLLSSVTGVSQEHTAKIYRLFNGLPSITGKTTDDIVGMGAELSSLSGIPIREVFKDVADSSNETLTLLGKSPILIMRMAVEARRMGTTLDSMSKSARGLLNYQNSMTAELEFSALMGKNISFQLARQYAWEGKIEKSRRVALDQLGSIDEFNRLNVYQKEAAANAAGIEVSEIVKQLGMRKSMADYEKKLNDDLLAAEKAGDNSKISRIKNEQNNLVRYHAKQAALEKGNDQLQAKRIVDQFNRQSRLNEITNRMDEIWTRISNKMMDITEKILPYIEGALEVIAKSVREGGWGTIGFYIGATIAGSIILGLLTIKASTEYIFRGVSKSLATNLSDELKDALKRNRDAQRAARTGTPTPPSPAVPRGPASGSSPSVPPTPSASAPVGKSDSIKIKEFLTNLSDGLKRMADPKVAVGAKNLLKSIPGLIGMSVGGAAGAKKISELDGEKISSVLNKLRSGLSSMSATGVERGSINLLLSIPGLIGMKLGGAAGANSISRINGEKLQSALISLSSGLASMSAPGVFRGSINLAGAAAALFVMIGGIPILATLGGLGGRVYIGLRSLSRGLASFSDAKVLSGIGVMFLMGTAFIPFAYGISLLTGIDWKVVAAATVAMIGLAYSVKLLGTVMMTGLGTKALLLGAGGMLLLGTSLIPLAYAAKLAAPGILAISEGLSKLLTPLTELAKSAWGLPTVALGIGAISAAMLAFAGSSLFGKVVSFFAGDPFKQFDELANKSDKISEAADSMRSLKDSVSDLLKLNLNPLKDINSFVDNIKTGKININVSGNDLSTVINDRIRTSVEVALTTAVEVNRLSELHSSIDSLTDAVGELTAAAHVISKNSATVDNSQYSQLSEKFDVLISMLREGLKIDADFKTLTSRAR